MPPTHVIKSYKTRNASFTLNERLTLLKYIRPKITIVDAHSSDITASESKNKTWEDIQHQFVIEQPHRQQTSAKELRELWRRMKHRARIEVRESVRKAKMGSIPTVSEDQMGWLPADNTSQKIININDLGLDTQTRFITEFVPLLEEEATVLDARNGDMPSLKDSVGVIGGNRRDTDDGGLRDVFECADEMLEDDVVEVLEERPQPEVKTEPLETTEEEETPSARQIVQEAGHRDNVSTSPAVSNGEGPPLGLQITSIVSQGKPISPSHKAPSLPPIPRKQPLNLPPTSQEMDGNSTRIISADSKSKELAELSLEFLRAEHDAKMELVRLKQEAAKAKLETARAKRSAYDEKRMFYFEKRKQLHDTNKL